MHDESPPRVQQLEEQIAQWNDEQTYKIRAWREHNDNLKQTLALAVRVAVWGSIPSLLWILAWLYVHNADGRLEVRLFNGCVTIFGFLIVLAGTMRGCGLMAYWWFRRSVVNERIATIILTLTGVSILFGWVVVLF